MAMAGAIDIHSHVSGGKVNLARLLMSEDHRDVTVARRALTRSGGGQATPSSFVTVYRYAAMGYTAAFEPGMLPSNPRSAHLEMAAPPTIDKRPNVLLG